MRKRHKLRNDTHIFVFPSRLTHSCYFKTAAQLPQVNNNKGERNTRQGVEITVKDMTQTLADDYFLHSCDSVVIHAEQTLLKTYTFLIYIHTHTHISSPFMNSLSVSVYNCLLITHAVYWTLLLICI